jgi:hypothetical protein
MKLKTIQKTYVFLLLFIFVIFVSARNIEAAKIRIRVIAEKVDVRLKPDEKSVSILSPRVGTVFESEEMVGDWFKINLPPDENGVVVTGYILFSQVEIVHEEIAPPVPPPAPRPKEEPPVPREPRPPFPKAQEKKKSGVTLGLKLSGGMGYLLNGAGDLENVRTERESYYQDLEDADPYTKSTFNWKRLSTVPNFEATLLLRFGKMFGVGIGSGYIWGSSKGDYGEDYDEIDPSGWYQYLWTDMYSRNYKVSAIPIRLNVYVFYPIDSMEIYGYAGVGYYFGKLTNDYTDDFQYHYQSPYSGPLYQHEEIYNYQKTENSTSNAVGFNFGFGIQKKLSSSIALMFEIAGRMVNFKKWEGNFSWSYDDRDRYWLSGLGWYSDATTSGSDKDSGTLWYYKYRDSYLGKSYGNMWIRTDKPTGSSYSDAREAAINLNAFGIALSVIIYFDLF